MFIMVQMDGIVKIHILKNYYKKYYYNMLYFCSELYHIFVEKALLTFMYNFYKEINENDIFNFYVNEDIYLEKVNSVYKKDNKIIALFTNNFIIDIKFDAIYFLHHRFNKQIYINRYMDFFVC